MKRQQIITYLTLLIEVLGISIIIPAFPELKAYYGVGDFAITMGLTIYSLFAFLGAPALGQWSDRVGRKRSLVRCIFGTMVSYFVLLIQPRYIIFLLARVINGMTGGNISIIQAVLTDMSPTPEEKSKSFGMMGAFFGLGFIIGPVLGSLLLQIGGVEAIFLGGGVIALIQLIVLTVFFENTNILNHSAVFHYNPFRTIKTYMQRATLKPWLISFIFLGIGGFIVNMSQSLYMANEFGTPGIRYGYYLAGLGVLSALNMAILVPRFWTQKFTIKQLLKRSYTCLIVGFIAISFLTTEWSYISAFYVVILLGGMWGVLYNIEIMGHAREGEVGRLSGMLGSLQNLTMVVGPFMGGLLLESPINMHWGAALCILIGGLVILRYL